MLACVFPELLRFVLPTFSVQFFHLASSVRSREQSNSRGEVCYKTIRKTSTSPVSFKKKRNDDSLLSLLTPVRTNVAKHVFQCFESDKRIREEARSHGITNSIFRKSLRRLKQAAESRNTTLLSMKVNHVLQGISQQEYRLSALLPLLVDHGHELYPETKNYQLMKHISDMSDPTMWYPEARSMFREIIFHAGPTNSGKTHAALQRFLQANSGVYCGPLRLLAREICQRSREQGVACDMITGDDHDYAFGRHARADKVACTVEMTNLNKVYDVAVIDEIQMVSDIERGWAWTRAFLGVCAKEIHVCGEERALNMIKKLTEECGDSISVERYKRLGQLHVKKNPVLHLEKLQPGDCIVCFKKDEIYNYKNMLEDIGIEPAIIYGSLPPRTKMEQAKRFNDPDNSCNILVTTDAIGMGLNLNIKRIIFNDIKKTTLMKGGQRKVAPLTPYHALQIAGRAGRFGSEYPDGAVTTMKSEHIRILHELLRTKVPDIKVAGLHPTFDMIEKFAVTMGTTSLYDVLTLFITMCATDKSLYFMCSLEECRDVAEALKDLKIPLRDMYTFCQSPISTRRKFVLAVLASFVKMHSKGVEVYADDLKSLLNWPPQPAKSKEAMLTLEDIHECLRLYLWLSFRFPHTFVNAGEVKAMSKRVDKVTSQSVSGRSQIATEVQTNRVHDGNAWKELNEFLLDN